MTLEDYFNETRTVMVHLLYLTNAKSLDHDLSDNQRRTLEVLLENDDLTAGRITETLDIKPSSTTAIIKQLTKLQLEALAQPLKKNDYGQYLLRLFATERQQSHNDL